MLLREDTDKRIELVDITVNSLQPRRQRRPPRALHRSLGRPVTSHLQDVAVGVDEPRKVEDIGVVQRVVGIDLRVVRKHLCGLAGDGPEGGLSIQPVRLAQVVV